MNLKKPVASGAQRGAAPKPEAAFLAVSDARVQRLVDALDTRGTALVLTGAPGCGKSYLAQHAAHSIAAASPVPVQQVLVRQLDDLLQLCQVDPHTAPHEASEQVLRALDIKFPGHEIVIVALGLDTYHGDKATFFEHLVRAQQVRLLGTARQVVGAVDRLARDPAVKLQAIEPFSIDESKAYLSRLLGVDRLAGQVFEGWYTATLGNPHALATLAIAAERRGAIRRVRRSAWIAPEDDQPPADFIAQLDDLNTREQDTLELVAFAAPLHEASLLQLLDADTVTALLSAQVLSVRTDASGFTAIVTRLPVLAAAIREHLSPMKRLDLATLCFKTLLAEKTALTTATRKRLVYFGMAAHQDLPANWMWQSMRAAGRSGELHYTLRLALGAMTHEEPLRSAEAILKACDLAHFLGEAEALDEALLALTAQLDERKTLDSLPFEFQLMLVAMSLCVRPRYAAHPELATRVLDRWGSRWAAQGLEPAAFTQGCRMRVLTLNGRLRDALALCEPHVGGNSLNAEWLSAPARTFESLIRAQMGQFREALALAENARNVVLLHEISPTFSGDLEGFAVFMAHWARGTIISAKGTLDQLAAHARPDLHAVQRHTGLLELGTILFTLREARWNDAAELTESLTATMQQNDPIGIMPLVHAAAALALAALGEDDHARAALHRSEMREPFGLSIALHGFHVGLTLRARQWLRDPELIVLARAHAEWARDEHLPLIELKALDVVAHQSALPDPSLLARAEALAPLIDDPVGSAILAHIRAVQLGHDEADSDERLLSELGIWMPLPPASQLTGREREVALFTALGYSSKYVAERLQLSARTVESHLTHVYTKLDLEGREALRSWFSHGRETV